MPVKNKKPCSYVGCPELVEIGTQYCAKHQAKVYADYDKYERTEERKERYQGSWKSIRIRFIKEHPFCDICFQNGIMTPAVLVHHRKPLAEGGTNDPANLQSLCKPCHSRLHTERGDYLHK